MIDVLIIEGFEKLSYDNNNSNNNNNKNSNKNKSEMKTNQAALLVLARGQCL